VKIDSAAVKRILVIKLRHIGDVLLTVPVFRALRENFPDAHIAALVNSGTEEALDGNPLIDEIIRVDRSIKKLSPLRRYARELTFLKDIRGAGFDLSVDLTGGDRAAVVSFVSGARYRIGWNPRRGFMGKKFLYTHVAHPRGRKHMVLNNLDTIAQFGFTTLDLAVDIHIGEPDRRSVRRLLEERGMNKGSPIVHVHPTSRWLFKCWRDDYVADVIGRLARMGIDVAITSSPETQELRRINNILSLLPPGTRHANLAGMTSIKQLAALSEMASLFFGVDTAPMHIAAAIGRPVVALFGPTSARRWGPWDCSVDCRRDTDGFQSPYRQKNGIQTAGKHVVIQRNWECVPCGKDGCDGSKKSKCLEDVRPEEVMQIIMEILEKGVLG
jgi:heptosyltransferase-3